VVVTPDDVARFDQRVGSIIRPALRDARSRYAGATRYPNWGENVGREEWREAVEQATAVVRWAESLVAAADA
jgi:hypothetical protein